MEKYFFLRKEKRAKPPSTEGLPHSGKSKSMSEIQFFLSWCNYLKKIIIFAVKFYNVIFGCAY